MNENRDDSWRSQFERVRPHLDELRRRMIVAFVAVMVGTVVAFAFAGQVIEFLAQPVGGRQGLSAIEVTENLGVYMRVSLTLGAVFAMPVIVYEIVAFVVPGLTPKEKRFLYLALPMIIVSFLAGVAFAYFVMIPPALDVLLNFGGIPTVPRPKEYIGFITRVVFWVGVAFETPLVIAVLARLGIVTPEMLKRNWRTAVVIVAVLAALITPTIDPINMLIVMTPLLALYVISIVLAGWTYRQRSEANLAED